MTAKIYIKMSIMYEQKNVFCFRIYYTLLVKMYIVINSKMKHVISKILHAKRNKVKLMGR